MIFHSIRWRFQAWHGVILVAVLAGFGFTAHQVARDDHLRRIDADLDQRLMALLRPLSPGPVRELFPGRPPGEPPDQRFGEVPGPPPDGPRDQGPGRPPGEPRNRPPGPSADGPRSRPPGLSPGESRDARPFDSPSFLSKVRDAVQQGGALDPSQTNVFYYVLWQADGSVLARSPGAPDSVPAPESVGSPGSEGL